MARIATLSGTASRSRRSFSFRLRSPRDSRPPVACTTGPPSGSGCCPAPNLGRGPHVFKHLRGVIRPVLQVDLSQVFYVPPQGAKDRCDQPDLGVLLADVLRSVCGNPFANGADHSAKWITIRHGAHSSPLPARHPSHLTQTTPV